MDLWKATNTRLRQRDFMGARALLLEADSPLDDSKLTRFAAKVITNYQASMMNLQDPQEMDFNGLVPQTMESRELDPLFLKYFFSERDRLQAELSRTRTEPEIKTAFFFHQVLSALGTLDGFRSSFWSCAAIDALEQLIQIDEELASFRDHSKRELSDTLAMRFSEQKQPTAKATTSWSKSNYEGIEHLRKQMLATGISSELYDKFVITVAEDLKNHVQGRPN